MTDTREILYTPIGAGWTSACPRAPVEMRRFMLTFQPIIDHLKSGESFLDGESFVRATDDGDYDLSDLHPILRAMAVTCRETWGVVPWTDGAPDLKIASVAGRVRIFGAELGEWIEVEGEFQDWL